MSEIITLSSDEENSTSSKRRNREEPPAKRIKTDAPSQKREETIVVLSDEEDKSVVNSHKKNKPIVLNKDDRPTVLDEEVKNKVTYKKGRIEVDYIQIIDEVDERPSKENDCEIVDPDQEPPKKCDEKENVSENPQDAPDSKPTMLDKNLTEPPCFTLLHNFLDLCEASVKNSSHSDVISKFPNIWKHFKQCESRLADVKHFRTLLGECTKKAKTSSVRAAVAFRDVYVFIKEACEADEVEVSKENRRKLKKLEHIMNLLVRTIKNLEESEVDFDDDEDSCYLQCDRYKNRLNKVYKRYCELLQKDPYSGRLTHAKLVFTNSHHDQINRAITKKFKNNDKFPTYFDMENLVKKVVKDENLKLGESEIKAESSHCFRKLGDLLQRRRKKELFDTHYSYIQDSEDPASKDCELNSILKDSYVQGQHKLDEIYEEFVTKAEVTKDEASGSHPSDSEDLDKRATEGDDVSTANKSID